MKKLYNGERIGIALFILPEKTARRLARPFLGLGGVLAKLANLGRDMRKLDVDYAPEEYAVVSALNAIAWSVLLALLVIFILYFQGGAVGIGARAALAPSLATFFILLVFFMYYPRVIVRKNVEMVDRDLVYALKELLVQINSGVPLFDALQSVSRSGHGKVSKEFGLVVKDINSGEPEERALERMAARTDSEFLKRTLWQMITVLKSGASLQGALQGIVENLQEHQNNQIKKYTQEMNLWILLFIIVAVVIPSLGATLLIILSTLGGVGMSEGTFLALVVGCFALELVLVEFMKVRRPFVYI